MEGPVTQAERDFYNRGWWGRAWPVTVRLAIEFDSAYFDVPWWLPWAHFWRFGMRIGALGLALTMSIVFYIPEGMGPPTDA